MTTMVLKYGVRSIIEHGEEAAGEMHAAHVYYNELMEVTRARELALRSVMAQHVPELGEVERELKQIEEQIDSAYDDIRKARQQSRVKSEPTDEQRALLASLKERRPPLWERRNKSQKLFHSLVNDSRMAFDARTSGAPLELLEQIKEIGRQLREAKRIKNNPDVAQLAKALDTLKARKKAGAPATAKKGAANRSVFAAMLEEPQWHPAWKEQKEIEMQAHARLLQLRAESGLTAGTYTAAEHAVEQALETADDLPWFRKVDCGRKIGRQLPAGKPMTGARLMAGGDAGLSLLGREPLRGRKDPALRVERSANSTRSHWEYATIGLAIGKGDSRKLVSLQVLLHRPIPADAVITWAYLVPRSRGGRVTYTLQLTVNVECGLVQRERGQGECTVRLRWSRERLSDRDADKRGIVVAEIEGAEFAMDGEEYRALPGSRRRGAYEAMRFARELSSYEDIHFCGSKKFPERGAQAKLVGWMENNPEIVPDWLREATSARAASEQERGQKALGEWRRPSRLFPVAERWIREAGLLGPPVAPDARAKSRIQELWYAWKVARRAINQDLYTADVVALSQWLATQGTFTEFQVMGIWLDWWRRKSIHLATVSSDTQAKALGNRKNQYRCKAAELARRFATVAVYELDLASAAKRKAPDEDQDESWQQARYQRFAAAPSEFKEALKLAFGKDRYREIKRERSSDAPQPGGARKTNREQKNSTDVVDKPVAAE